MTNVSMTTRISSPKRRPNINQRWWIIGSIRAGVSATYIAVNAVITRPNAIQRKTFVITLANCAESAALRSNSKIDWYFASDPIFFLHILIGSVIDAAKIAFVPVTTNRKREKRGRKIGGRRSDIIMDNPTVYLVV